MNREAALERGNEIRIAGADVRRQIGALSRPEAFLRVAELLEHPPLEIQRMKAQTLLTAVPRVGKVVAKRLLEDVDVPPNVQIGPSFNSHHAHSSLTARQRFRLAAEIRYRFTPKLRPSELARPA